MVKKKYEIIINRLIGKSFPVLRSDKIKIFEFSMTNLYGVYVSKSSPTASTYGDYLLKLDLNGKDVRKSPHSNQYVVLGAIEAERILRIDENVR